MKTLEEYLLENIEKGFIDHSLRAQIDEDGSVSFYIHANGHNSDTLDFWVLNDKLTPKYQFEVKKEED